MKKNAQSKGHVLIQPSTFRSIQADAVFFPKIQSLITPACIKESNNHARRRGFDWIAYMVNLRASSIT
ncbi:hypothetical protein QWZ16_11985 [Vibrio ostreicida]|uniref:Uncharacterized protein n=1 Tax=Vibrio ostreicida TaxID=526588 RepID=A0ABT8BTF8_9VIBR|nr:hypothetical protein [Vibrio ostreicida]MDN3610425.1 hypothetical protein [Vibrio ostreicida]